MMKRIQQARRMSAVSKLLSKTLMKGAISATGHVIADVSRAGTTPAKEVSVASIDAFAKVVEVVESAGKSLLEMASFADGRLSQTQATQERYGTVDNAIHHTWTLNKEGLRVLFRATTASMAINVPPVYRFTSDPSSLPLSSKGIITNSSSMSFSSASYLHVDDAPVRSVAAQFPTVSTTHSTPTTAERLSLTKLSPPLSSPATSHASVPSLPRRVLSSSHHPPRPRRLLQQDNRRPPHLQQQHGYVYRSPDQTSENQQQ
eukprot:c25560_g1_i1 orf=420-1199(-)